MSKLKAALKKISLVEAIPFIAFIVIFLFFTIASYDEKDGIFRMLTARNLRTLLTQTMETVILACGVLFVVSQGSTDLSVGVNLALSGVIGTWFAHLTGIDFLMIPACLVVGLVVGLFNGFVVSKLKVSSFMVTLAMLIGVRGLVNYIQVGIDAQDLPASLTILNSAPVKIPLFIVIVLVMAYVFEFTKAGRYSRAIGENETTAKFVGVPVGKMKIVAFGIAGLMAGMGAIFSMLAVGGTSQQMGVFMEIRVVMAVYLGGVLVTGGTTAKFFKILLGSFSIQLIVVGLALMGKSQTQISQSVQGILLLIILFLSAMAGRRKGRSKSAEVAHHEEKELAQETTAEL